MALHNSLSVLPAHILVGYHGVFCLLRWAVGQIWVCMDRWLYHHVKQQWLATLITSAVSLSWTVWLFNALYVCSKMRELSCSCNKAGCVFVISLLIHLNDNTTLLWMAIVDTQGSLGVTVSIVFHYSDHWAKACAGEMQSHLSLWVCPNSACEDQLS